MKKRLFFIITSFVLSLFIIVLLSYLMYENYQSANGQNRRIEHAYKISLVTSELENFIKEAETGQRGFLLTGEERYLEPYSAAVKDVERYIQDLRELTVDNRNQQSRIATLQSLKAGKLGELAETIALRRQHGERAAMDVVLTDKGKDVLDEIRRVIGEMDAEESELLRQRDQNAKATAHFATASLLFGGLLILVLVSTAGILIQRSITRPLASFMEFVKRVGEGDLTQQAKISSRDELADLGQCLDQMVMGLKDVAGQTRFATQNLNSASAEILASTQQQAAGTAEQSAALQQTTTTMEEVTQSGTQISDRAKQVATAAEATSAASHAGLQAVESTTRTMEGIREQAEAVGEHFVPQ